MDQYLEKEYRTHKCPQNKAEWKDREREFKCPEINKAHVYHCVLNSEKTELVEVCAPVVNIQGNLSWQYFTYNFKDNSFYISDTLHYRRIIESCIRYL